MTAGNIFDKDYRNKKYSKVHRMRVNLEDFFNSDSFRLGKVDTEVSTN
jgi:hypothetical protein